LTRLEANTDELCLVGLSPYAEIRLKSEAVCSFNLDDGPLETGNDAFWIRYTFATNEADDARSVRCVFRVAYCCATNPETMRGFLQQSKIFAVTSCVRT
jgi:hypothetical protein